MGFFELLQSITERGYLFRWVPATFRCQIRFRGAQRDQTPLNETYQFSISTFMMSGSRFQGLLLACIFFYASARVAELGEKFMEYKDQHTWLIKFYAPWCTHCRQLEPVWNQVSQALVKTDVRVARLDCTRYTGLAQHFKVTGFPTIFYLGRNKELVYRGERSLEGILEFVRRVNGFPVRQLNSCGDLREALKMEPAMFVLAKNRDEMDNNESNMTRIYHANAQNMHPENYFLEVPMACIDQSATETTVFIHKDGNYHPFDPLGTTRMEDWITSERFPAFQKITHSNFQRILDTKKYLVAAILEENQLGKLGSQKMVETREMISSFASNTVDLYHKRFLFGWFAATDIPFSVAMTELPVPYIMVIEPGTLKYFLPEKHDDPESLVALLNSIIKQDPPALSYGGNTLLYRLYRSYFEFCQNIKNMYRSSPVLTIVVFIVPLGFLSALIYLTCCANLLDTETDGEDSGEDEPEKDSDHEKND